MRFYGLIISKHGIKPANEKVNDFIDSREPASTKDLHSFLGTAAHFAARIPYSALISKPLRQLLKKGKKYAMEDEHKKAFRQLKEAIILTCMSHFRSKWSSFLFSDAGPMGNAGILTQENPVDELDISLIGCGSHCFTDSELNYSHLEKEAFGIIWAVEFFHPYLYGASFTILTDSLAAKKIFSEDKPRKKIPLRLQRMKSRLQLYGKATITHIEGKRNIADFLSRHMPIRQDSVNNFIEQQYHINHVVEMQRSKEEIHALVIKQLVRGITIDELKEATKKDQNLMDLIECITGRKQLEQFQPLKGYGSMMEELWITEDGIVMRNNAIIMPATLQERAANLIHEAHLGMTLSKRLIKSRTWFHGADTMMENKVKDCLACQSNSDTTEHAPMIIQEIPKQNTSLVSLDFSSRTPTNDYLLVANYERARFPPLTVAFPLRG